MHELLLFLLSTHLVISIGVLNVLRDEADGLNRCQHFGCQSPWDDNLLSFCNDRNKQIVRENIDKNAVAHALLVLNRMSHVVVSIVVIILVLVRVLGDAVPVMISESFAIKLSKNGEAPTRLPHIHLIGVHRVVVFGKRVLRATHHQNAWHEL